MAPLGAFSALSGFVPNLQQAFAKLLPSLTIRVAARVSS